MFGLFRKKTREIVRFDVRFRPSATTLKLERGANLLEAALRHGVAAPYNCRVGACKTCRIKVLEGTPASLIEREYMFTREEMEDGAFLACQTTVQSDMVVSWHAEPPTAVTLAATLVAVRRMTPRIQRVELRLEEPLSWRAGQFARLRPAGLNITPRSYSMVAPGRDDTLIAFDVTRYLDGAVSSWLSDPGNLEGQVMVEAPFGEFGLDGVAGAPLLCIAGGSGMGAIGGILASHAHRVTELHGASASPAPVLLVVGARDRAETYGLDELRSTAEHAKVPFQVDIVLDREPVDSGWQGRRGYVAEHLPQILRQAAQRDPRFSQPEQSWRVLLCGPTPLVDTSIEALRRVGMEVHQMAFDKYAPTMGGASPTGTRMQADHV